MTGPLDVNNPYRQGKETLFILYFSYTRQTQSASHGNIDIVSMCFGIVSMCFYLYTFPKGLIGSGINYTVSRSM